MKMRRLVMTIVLMYTCINVHGQSLSLESAMGLMQTQNSKMKALQKQHDAQHFKHKQHIALRLPLIGLTASAMHINQELEFDFTEQRNAAAALLQLPSPALLGDWKAVLQKQDMLSVDINMMYPIFTGGKINAAVRASEIQSEIKDTEITKEQNAMFSTLVERYFKTKLAQAAAELRQDALEVSQTHYRNAEKLEANGMIAQVEKMQAEAAVADAKRNLLAAQQDEDLAKTALWGLIGGEDEVQILSTELFISLQLKPLNDYVQGAAEHHPDMAALKLKANLAEQGVKVSKSAYFPSVALIGGKHVYTKNMPLEDDLDWFLGLGLQYTLFNGFKHHNQLKEAKAVQESVDLFQEQAEKDIATLVKSHYQDLEKHKQLAEALNKDLRFAQELLRVRQKAFAEGFAKSADVVDATLYVSSIKLKHLQALCNYDIALAKLLELCGDSHLYLDYINK